MFLLIAILAFIVVIAILVTVHEFGHYMVARLCGVKVLRFSIGFGRVLWLRHFSRDNSEFTLCAIPLGGYVKMLDEREMEGVEIALEELPRAFNRQSIPVRAAIVAAGPIFNFIFAIFTYSIIFMLGMTGLKPIIGEVTPQSLAQQAGLHQGDQIVAVDGTVTLRWDGVIQATLENLLQNAPTTVLTVKNQQDSQYDATLSLQGLTIDDVSEGRFFTKLGFERFIPPLPAIVDSVAPNMPAARADLRPDDKIIAVDGQTVTDLQQWLLYVSHRPKQQIVITLERMVQEQTQVITATLTPDDVDGKGRIGIYMRTPREFPPEYLATEYYSFLPAIAMGAEKTWEYSVFTLQIFAKMLKLEVSAKNISGPMTIAEIAGKSMQIGLVPFLTFLAIVSISLGVLNLLPIPLLDGGHLFMYLIEAIKGSPLNETAEMLLQRVGLTLLLSLMALALFNDFERLLRFFY
jgi:regulator of sigma E protease